MERSLRAKKAQIQMIRDRGYLIPPHEEEIVGYTDSVTGRVVPGMNLEEFAAYLEKLRGKNNQEKATLSLLRQDYFRPNKESILVYYASKGEKGKQVPSSVVKIFVELVKKNEYDRSILIVDAPLSTGKNGATSDLKSLDKKTYQIFHLSELYVPIQHFDVPIHRLLSEEEKRSKMKELRVNNVNMPWIRLDDPVVKYYGWPEEGMVMIIRNDYGSGLLVPESINYRIIVP